MNADRIGTALKGRPNGAGWLVCCPVIGHGKRRGDRSPSLSVADADDGRLLLKCFAGCEFTDVLDALRGAGLVDDGPKSDRARPALSRVDPMPVEHAPDPDALKLWLASKPAVGTIVEKYLNCRGIASRPPPTLRCGSTQHLGRINMPLMVAGVQRPDGKIVATQSLMLTHKGTKASISQPRDNKGNLGQGAVRLCGSG